MIFRRFYLYERPVWLPYAAILAASTLIIALSIWFHNKEYAAKYREELFVQDATVTSNITNKTDHIQLPYSRMGANRELLDFVITVNYPADSPAFFKVVPDDCVNRFTVNDKAVSLSPGMIQKHCDYVNGFTIDLARYLQPGTNTVRIQVLNRGGLTGLKFIPVKVAPVAQ